MPQLHRFLKFGNFLLDVEQAVVYKYGPRPRAPITLTPSAVSVLITLAKNSVAIDPLPWLSRDKIRELAVVSESSVGNHVVALREALGAAYIPGLRTRGYRLDPPASWFDDKDVGVRHTFSPQEVQLTHVEQSAGARLYQRSENNIYVSAIRLWGAGDAYVTRRCFGVTYNHKRVKIPADLKEKRDRWIVEKKLETRSKGQPFFDGPIARFIGFQPQACEHLGTAREIPRIELTLGRLEWFDFEGMNGRLRGKLTPEEFEHYLKVSEILNNKDVSHSILTNIVDCNVTIVTPDEYVGYLQRSGNVASVPNKLSSSVSENINRFKDDATKDGRALMNPKYERVPTKKISKSYRPRGVPHPFWTARRGIKEEISKVLLRHLRPNAIKLTGICYNLEGYHPDLLFVAAVDLPKDEILKLYADRPGVDFGEGELRFTKASFDDPETQGLFADRARWVPGDEASLFRAIELIEALQDEDERKFSSVFDVLATAS